MLDEIDALIMLEKFGTVSEAAVRLRLTQSAVSKRIQALQQTVGFQLVEPDGRRIRLTSRAIEFVERARPLVAELRGIANRLAPAAPTLFSLGMADSIASSWGPGVIRTALAGSNDLRVALHVHRTALLVESVRLGRYQIGLCTDSPAARDLIRYSIIDEPMVLIHCGLGDSSSPSLPLIAIEPGAATWLGIEPSIRQNHRRLLHRETIPVESFPATVQMVKAGFGDGLAPLGLVLEMGLDKRCYRKLTGVRRKVILIARKSVHQVPAFQAFRKRLILASSAYFGRTPRAS